MSASRFICLPEDGRIMIYPVVLSWDRGFDVAAKMHYIDELKAKANKMYGLDKVVDLTTANKSEKWYRLSPVYVKYDNGETVDDAYLRLKGADSVSNKFCFTTLYLYGLVNNHRHDFIQLMTMKDVAFCDVFAIFKPSYLPNTQSLSMAYIKVLCDNDTQFRRSVFNGVVDAYVIQKIEDIVSDSSVVNIINNTNV